MDFESKLAEVESLAQRILDIVHSHRSVVSVGLSSPPVEVKRTPTIVSSATRQQNTPAPVPVHADEYTQVSIARPVAADTQSRVSTVSHQHWGDGASRSSRVNY